MMRKASGFVLAAAAAALLPGCAIAPVAPQGAVEPVDLHVCYLWGQQPPAGRDKTADYFILSDGRPSFLSVKWVPGLDAAPGCDAVFSLAFTMPFLTAHWTSVIYSGYGGLRVGEAQASGNNFSGIAAAVYRALRPGTEAYARINADKNAAAAPPSPPKKEEAPTSGEVPWWRSE